MKAAYRVVIQEQMHGIVSKYNLNAFIEHAVGAK